MMTWRWVGLQPACSTMASVMARQSARFCAGVRPVHICTVTTGMRVTPSSSRIVLQYSFDAFADAAPLARTDRDRRPAAKSPAPDRVDPKSLGGLEIDPARRCGKIDHQRRGRQLSQHFLADDACRDGRKQEVEFWRKLRQ